MSRTSDAVVDSPGVSGCAPARAPSQRLPEKIVRSLADGTFVRRFGAAYSRWRQRRRNAWWRARAGGMGSCIAAIQPGVRMRLHFDSELCGLIYGGDFEAGERTFFNRYLRPGDTVVDVGANVGLFTLIAAARVGPEGRVHSFEPCQRTFERLAENVALNRFRSVTCHPAALSDRRGALRLFAARDGRDAWNSCAEASAAAGGHAETVQSLPWDEFAREQSLVGSVALMKIDVEGWESRVLAGGRETLSRDDAPLLQVEFTDSAALAAGTTCAALYRQLEDLGYRILRYDAECGSLAPDPLRDAYPYVNLYAAKRPAEAQARLANGGMA